VIVTGHALYRPAEARQTAELLLLSLHCALWSVIRTSASCRQTSSSRILLHDDIIIPYLVTMIGHGCCISWVQRGRSLRGRPHETYNTCMISKSADGPPRYMTEHVQYIVNDVSRLGSIGHQNYNHAAAQAVPQLSHSSMRGGTGIHHVLHYLGYILHQ